MVKSLIQVALHLLSDSFAQILNGLIHIVCYRLSHQYMSVAVEASEIVLGLLEIKAIPLVAVHKDSQGKFTAAEVIRLLVILHQQHRDSFYFLGDQHYLFGVRGPCCVSEQ